VAAAPAPPAQRAEISDENHQITFLFGTDEVAPPDQEKYLKVYYQYGPLWDLLTSDARRKVRTGNYERIFDEARRRVRSWEASHNKE